MKKELSWKEETEREMLFLEAGGITVMIIIFGIIFYVSYLAGQLKALLFAWLIFFGTFGIVYGILKFKYWLEKQ